MELSGEKVEHDGWDHWEDIDATNTTGSGENAGMGTTNEDGEYWKIEEYAEASPHRVTPQMPLHIHPIMSSNIRRMSSCYFSIASDEDSTADFTSLFEDAVEGDVAESDEGSPNSASRMWNGLLYHDILMHVFGFLDTRALAAFSETARRPNYEVFYYLQLNMQLAIMRKDREDHRRGEPFHDSFGSLASLSCLSRLAHMNHGQAQAILMEYLDSNSTLRSMPLSHSLAYFRHALRQHGFPSQVTDGSALVSAAFVMTLVGAAFVTGASNADPETLANMTAQAPNMIMGMGFVGSLMGAASKMSAENDDQASQSRMTMRQAAEQLARSMHQLPSNMMRQVRRPNQVQPTDETKTNDPSEMTPVEDHKDSSSPLHRLRCAIRSMMPLQLEKESGQKDSDRSNIYSRPSMVFSPDPYAHKSNEEEKKNEFEDKNGAAQGNGSQETNRKMPSGCVGAYARSIRTAEKLISDDVKRHRIERFEQLPQEERDLKSTAFIDASGSDANLPLLKSLIDIDVDGFYTGSDGSEMCALHNAALYDATEVLSFLCKGIDPNNAENDGGICDINLIDSNGWTCVHYAAGANNPRSIRILVSHGAKLDVKATNGYTPLLWAQRLSNQEAVDEIVKLKSQNEQTRKPLKPLSEMASRFFSFIPNPSH